MGLRQPSQIATFYKQAASGAEQQKKAREKLKQQTPPGQPVQALGGSAAAGTQMVAATTGAQQQATQQVQKKGTELQSAVSGEKVTTPTATAAAYTSSDPNKLPGGTPTSIADKITTEPTRGYQTVKIGTKSIKIPIFTSNAEKNIETLKTNQTDINNSLSEIQNAIKKHDEGVEVLTAQDLKNLEESKKQLMDQWQKFDDAIRKENLGEIAAQSAGESAMQERERVLAEEGDNVGKLASIFGPRFNARKYGALASQIYGKDLEAIQEAAAAGLKESDIAKKEAGAAEEQYISQLGTSKESVEKKVKSEQDKLDALKIGWEALKNRGETLKSLSAIFGSEVEAKKYFNFDDKGNLVSDKRSQVRDALAKKESEVKTELGKTETKLKSEEDRAFTNISSELIVKDQYGNIVGGSLPTIKTEISKSKDLNSLTAASGDQRRDLANQYLNNLASVEAEINNAISSKDGKRVKTAKDKLNKLMVEYQNELKKLELPGPTTKDVKGNIVLNFKMLIPGKAYRGPDGKLYGRVGSGPSGKYGMGQIPVYELDENGKPIKPAIEPKTL